MYGHDILKSNSLAPNELSEKCGIEGFRGRSLKLYQVRYIKFALEYLQW